MTTRYTYGDSEPAARRLEKLDEAYRGRTADFLRDVSLVEPDLAVDLGCGPGYTTATIDRTLHPKRLLAVDRSADFLKQTAERNPTAETIEYDVATMQPPWSAADLVFCRFLLGHLVEPLAVLESWVATLAPGGVVAVQEYEWIESEHPAVARYLEISEGMVSSTGAALRIGPTLAEAFANTPRTDVEVLMNAPASFNVGPDLMASIFLLNLPAMRANEAASADQLGALEDDLTALASSDATITACVRELALRR